jgi:hypothetical protein
VIETSLPPDLERKLLNKDLANQIQRVHKGGKLTRAERSMLQNVTNNTLVAEKAGPAFAPNLCNRLKSSECPASRSRTGPSARTHPQQRVMVRMMW